MSYIFFAMDHDVSSPNATSVFSNIRIYENATSAPSIISTPSIEAFVGSAYYYDADRTVNVESQLTVSFSLEKAPLGMTVNDLGVITWIPTEDQVGDHNVTIIASNELGIDTQDFVITVNEPDNNSINFYSLTFQSYGGSYKGIPQDSSNGVV